MEDGLRTVCEVSTRLKSPKKAMRIEVIMSEESFNNWKWGGWVYQTPIPSLPFLLLLSCAIGTAPPHSHAPLQLTPPLYLLLAFAFSSCNLMQHPVSSHLSLSLSLPRSGPPCCHHHLDQHSSSNPPNRWSDPTLRLGKKWITLPIVTLLFYAT